MREHYSLRQSNLIYLLWIIMSLAIEAAIYYFSSVSPLWTFKYSVYISQSLRLACYFIILAIAANMKVKVKTGLGLRGFNFKKLLLAAAVSVMTYIVIRILSIYVDLIMRALGVGVAYASVSGEASPWWSTLILICVLAPVCEEFLFRGVIFSGYKARLGVVKGAIVTGLMFGLMHLVFPSALILSIAGIVLGIVAGYTGSLFLAMIMHALHNFMAYTGFIDDYVIFGIKYFIRPELFSTGTFVWALVLLTLCFIGLCAAVARFKRWHDKETAAAAQVSRYPSRQNRRLTERARKAAHYAPPDVRPGVGYLIASSILILFYSLTATWLALYPL